MTIACTEPSEPTAVAVREVPFLTSLASHWKLTAFATQLSQKFASTDSSVEALEILPLRSVQRVGQSQQVLVRARYSDGRAEDVTRWVKWSSADESVCRVDDDGKTQVIGPGEGALHQVAVEASTSIVRQHSAGLVADSAHLPAVDHQRHGYGAEIGDTAQSPRLLAARQAIDDAFVSVFNLVMLAAGVVALAAAAAGAMIR